MQTWVNLTVKCFEKNDKKSYTYQYRKKSKLLKVDMSNLYHTKCKKNLRDTTKLLGKKCLGTGRSHSILTVKEQFKWDQIQFF